MKTETHLVPKIWCSDQNTPLQTKTRNQVIVRRSNSVVTTVCVLCTYRLLLFIYASSTWNSFYPFKDLLCSVMSVLFCILIMINTVNALLVLHHSIISFILSIFIWDRGPPLMSLIFWKTTEIWTKQNAPKTNRCPLTTALLKWNAAKVKRNGYQPHSEKCLKSFLKELRETTCKKTAEGTRCSIHL